MISAMPTDDEPKSKPVAIDPNAISASPTEPAFVARPKGAPAYYGFAVLGDVSVEGFTFGAITDPTQHVEEVRPFERDRWGV